jgi:hypothetical protein
VAGFDLEKFQTETFKARESEVAVAELAPFFGEGEKAIWRVRGLTGSEVARVKDSVQRAKDVEGLVAKLAGTMRDKIDGVMTAFGLNVGDESDDYVRRLTVLELGSIDPKIKRENAVRVADVAPILFYRLTDEIYMLTGRGKVGESIAFGTTPESGQASPSVPEAV